MKRWIIIRESSRLSFMNEFECFVGGVGGCSRRWLIKRVVKRFWAEPASQARHSEKWFSFSCNPRLCEGLPPSKIASSCHAAWAPKELAFNWSASLLISLYFQMELHNNEFLDSFRHPHSGLLPMPVHNSLAVCSAANSLIMIWIRNRLMDALVSHTEINYAHSISLPRPFIN